MHGVAVFRGTRVPVQTLFDYLEGDETLENFLQGFPTVSRAKRWKKPSNYSWHAVDASSDRRAR